MNSEKAREYYSKFEPYEAKPTGPTTRLDEMSDAALIAWFRCASCPTCKFRAEVLEEDPSPAHDIHWCAATHDRINIVDMVRYLGYTRE